MSYIRLTKKSDWKHLFRAPFVPQKVVFSNSSDFYEEGNRILKVDQKQLAVDEGDEHFLHNTLPEFRCGNSSCMQSFSTVRAYEVHYRSCHVNVCSECKKAFPSSELLDLHIQEKHDSYIQAVAASKLGQTYKCPIETCDALFDDTSERNGHLIKVHKYPPNFKYSDFKTSKAERMDTAEESECLSKTKVENKKSVPTSICFGRNAARGFHHHSRKTKPPREKQNDTDISMKELKEAL